jgi:hypothetical protein
MDANSEHPSAADLADEAGGLVVGLGLLTMTLFPFAVPLLILVIGPLAVVGLAVAVLAIPILLPLWLGRLALRALRGRREGPAPVKLPIPNEGDRSGQVWLAPGRAAARGHRHTAGQRR